jgi:hypothetical protein
MLTELVVSSATFCGIGLLSSTIPSVRAMVVVFTHTCLRIPSLWLWGHVWTTRAVLRKLGVSLARRQLFSSKRTPRETVVDVLLAEGMVGDAMSQRIRWRRAIDISCGALLGDTLSGYRRRLRHAPRLCGWRFESQQQQSHNNNKRTKSYGR